MRNIFIATAVLLVASCGHSPDNSSSSAGVKSDSNSHSPASAPVSAPKDSTHGASAAEILAKRQVPVLCYHHIRPASMPSRSSQGYDITEEAFKDQLKALADSGYKTILPDQYYNYLVYGSALPEKPVMLTYDDTDEEQFSIAKKEMDKYGYKGVYFIMSISINRPRYMTKEQMKQLADEGHAVECHTWDHHRTDRYNPEDWPKQLDKPKATIESITGKPVQYFAYPFGVWSASGFPELQKRGYKMAFQLSMKRDSSQPLYTVRRIIVPGWSGKTLLSNIRGSFK